MRLDNYLVINNHFTTRNKAQNAIKSNRILVNDKVIKSNYKLKINDYFSGCQLIEASYKEIKKSYLLVFDEYMDEIKNRILKHIRAKDGGAIRDYYGYNANVVLDRIERKVEKLYEEMNNDDLKRFEAQIARSC